MSAGKEVPTKPKGHKTRYRTKDNVLSIETTCDDNSELFDDQKGESFPDVTIDLPNCSENLSLHRVILSKASQGLGTVFRGKPTFWCTYNAQSRHLAWKTHCDSDVEGSVLKKWLHFCYGSEMYLTIYEAVAGLWTLMQLKLRQEEELGLIIKQFIAPEVPRNVEIEVQVLKQCIAYGKDCDQAYDTLIATLAERVLSRDNITNNFDLVVDHCLMELPPSFLDKAHYGDVWTKYSEFELRKLYIERHSNELSAEDKDRIMSQCKEVMPNSSELKQMVEQGSFSQESLLMLFQKALEHCEKERDAQKARADAADATIATMRDEAKKRDEEMKALQSKQAQPVVVKDSLCIQCNICNTHYCFTLFFPQHIIQNLYVL